MVEIEPAPVRTEIRTIHKALQEGHLKRMRKALKLMHPAKIASLLESLPDADRAMVWEQIDDAAEPKILAQLDEPMRSRLMGENSIAGTEIEKHMEGETLLQQVFAALAQGRLKRLGRLFRKIHPARVAGLLESLPPAERSTAWQMIEGPRAGKVLRHLHREVRRGLVEQTDMDDLVVAARALDQNVLVDLIQDLPDPTGKEILKQLDRQEREQIESMLSYPEDSAGGLMNMDHIFVRENLRVRSVLRYLRLREELPEHTDKLMVVDRQQGYLGVLRLRRLLTSQPEVTVADLMDRKFAAISADTSKSEVARRFENHDLLSVPVVNEEGRLLGRITVDDVVDVIREESEHSLMGMAGLDEDADMFAPVLTSSRRRAVWLGINLVTAFLAAWVIGLFEATLQQVVALAVLMPIVASMGGIAGSQTLTLVIRGLALGHLERGNTRILLAKEIGIGLLNGLLWSLVVALLAVVWFGDWMIGGIIGIAILLNLLCAALAGVAIPLAMQRLNIDPALAGGVVLTTVTDVVGFFAFLGLATLLLL